MNQIIKYNYVEYKTINIKNNTSTLKYLQDHNFTFRLQQLDPQIFAQIQHTSELFKLRNENLLAGYANISSNHLKEAGGLKLSDPQGIIPGTFIIEETEIIYNPRIHFYEERDTFVYNGLTYYTPKNLTDLLKEELFKKRKYLIYLGEKLQNYDYIPQFEEVSAEELISYDENQDKGEAILSRSI